MNEGKRYYRLTVKKIPPYFAGVGKAYYFDEDISASSAKEAAEIFSKQKKGTFVIKHVREISESDFRGQNVSGRASVMSVTEAVKSAKKKNRWHPGPTSVWVEFINGNGLADDVKLDVTGKDTEAAVFALWGSLCRERGMDPDSVISIETWGYIM